MALYQELSGELETTNQGVVALYAEIDDKSRQLREASEAKTRFLRNISHELRTPGNSVLGLSRLLLHAEAEPLTEEQRRQVEFIEASALDLVRLVNELLDLARAESGHIEPTVDDVDLQKLFGELEGTTAPLVSRPGVTLVVEDASPVGVIRTDRALLAHVLRNLLSNAVKFTEAGEVRMSAQSDGSVVRITVRDTGIGIAPEDQPQVFEEFFQVRTRLQAGAKGSGLGLPFARRIANILGGDLTLSSDLGEGSTFVVELPIVGPSAGTGRRRGAMTQTPEASVLVCDDTAAKRYVIASWLRREGYEVLEAETGSQALEVASRGTIDLAVLDVHLPDMSGLDVCARMKADPRTAATPVMHISAIAVEPKDRSAGLENGADAYMVDPIEPQEMLSMVRALLRSSGFRRSAERLAVRLQHLAAASLRINVALNVSRLATAASEACCADPRLRVRGRPAGRLRSPPLPGPRSVASPRTSKSPKAWRRGCWTAPRSVPTCTRRTSPGRPFCPAATTALGRSARSARSTTRPGSSQSLRPRSRERTTRCWSSVCRRRCPWRSTTCACSWKNTAWRWVCSAACCRRRFPRCRDCWWRPDTGRPTTRQRSVGTSSTPSSPTYGDRVVVIGDVQGHSLEAAVVMAELRYSLRAYVFVGLSPEEVLERTNDVMLRSHPELIATLCMLVFPAGSQSMLVANAGHIPPLLVRDGVSSYLEFGGTMMGVDRPPEKSLHVPVSAGTRILLMTDGLVERRGEDMSQAMDRLARSVEELSTMPAEMLCDQLMGTWGGGEDDVALIVLDVLAGAPAEHA